MLPVPLSCLRSEAATRRTTPKLAPAFVSRVPHRLMVSVFDSRARVEAALTALLEAGIGDDRLAIVAPPEDAPRVADALTTCGLAAESADYSAAEVGSGRFLLVVRAAPGETCAVIAAVGKHCGCMRAPPAGA